MQNFNFPRPFQALTLHHQLQHGTGSSGGSTSSQPSNAASSSSSSNESNKITTLTSSNATSSNSSANPNNNCAVCDIETSESSGGVTACSACKKFFLRNQTQLQTFNCITGRNDCDVSRRTTASKHGETLWPRKLKLICRRCRLAKAFAAGFSLKGSRRFHGLALTSPKPNSHNKTNESSSDSPSPPSSSAGEGDEADDNRRISNAMMITADVRMFDEINASAESYANAATLALRELMDKLAVLPTVTIQPTAVEDVLLNLVAMDFQVTGKYFVEYVRKLPNLGKLPAMADVKLLQDVYPGLKACAVSSPFKQRSFVSCFDRCIGFGRCSLVDIEILDECVRLIESTIEMWRPSMQELATLMAIHTYQSFENVAGICSSIDDNAATVPQPSHTSARSSHCQTPVTLLYVALGSMLSKSSPSRSAERLSIFKHVLSMLKIMAARWQVTLARLAQTMPKLGVVANEANLHLIASPILTTSARVNLDRDTSFSSTNSRAMFLDIQKQLENQQILNNKQ